ncbi:MAG: molecular chaperone [Escherichia coli]|nr:molecular chaperone [Escherichia coli]
MNEFSILCRVLGSLYYRQPQDPLLVPLFTLIREGKLAANWPLEQDELLTRLQKSCDMAQVSADYNALFIGDECAVPEDQSTEDESEALETLFSEYLLPWCGAFLGKVEAHATTPFWRTMAPLTRDAISAMWDELEEDSEE